MLSKKKNLLKKCIELYLPLHTTLTVRHSKDIVEKNLHMLKLDKEVGYLFHTVLSYRRDRNIRDMLVHSKFSSKDVSGITLPCGRKCCLTCPFVFNEVHTVDSPPSLSFIVIVKIMRIKKI